MATDNGRRPTAEANKRVQDDENTVDQQYKTRIIEARERVDKAEQGLFVDVETDPEVQMAYGEQVATWATIVKQFLRAIEPLLRHEDVPDSAEYYDDKEIGEMMLLPPNTEGYEFELVGELQHHEPADIRRALDLPRGATLPQPRTKTFVGLKQVIEHPPVVEESWVVKVDASGPPAEHKYVYPTTQQPVSKQIYIDAVRHADQFLQGAGIGLDITEANEQKWGFYEVADDAE